MPWDYIGVAIGCLFIGYFYGRWEDDFCKPRRN